MALCTCILCPAGHQSLQHCYLRIITQSWWRRSGVTHLQILNLKKKKKFLVDAKEKEEEVPQASLKWSRLSHVSRWFNRLTGLHWLYMTHAHMHAHTQTSCDWLTPNHKWCRSCRAVARRFKPNGSKNKKNIKIEKKIKCPLCCLKCLKRKRDKIKVLVYSTWRQCPLQTRFGQPWWCDYPL